MVSLTGELMARGLARIPADLKVPFWVELK